jgi:5-methylcytosine-specific restriction endonuclease McrA
MLLTGKKKRPRTPGGIAIARDGYGPNWREQRRKALERDNYTCQQCGKRADPERWWRAVHVHHKRKIRWYYDHETGGIDYGKANDLDNLKTLCRACHKAVDAKLKGFKLLC